MKKLNLIAISLVLQSMLLFSQTPSIEIQFSEYIHNETEKNALNKLISSTKSLPLIGPKIKKLQLGMSFKESSEVLLNLCQNSGDSLNFLCREKDGKIIAAVVDSPLGSTVAAVSGPVSGGVDTVFFGSQAASLLFNSSDLTAKEFAEQIINNYDIPELNVQDNEWVYKSDEGWTVAINQFKGIVLGKSVSQSERKFD